MRLTYLDEAGTSHHETHAVVAGPIVHGDYQMAPVEQHLRSLMERHIPEKDWFGFVFHATDIWSGGKYFKNRELWPLEKRLAILEDLADIPKTFALPIAFGIANKARVNEQLRGMPSIEFADHMFAFADATQRIEKYFRRLYPDEFTLIIAEDRQKVRKAIKRVQQLLQGRGPVPLPEPFIKKFAELPYHHIRDTVHFAAKDESPLLQVADTCAFLLRGFVNQHPKSLALFARVKPAILPIRFSDDGEPLI